MEKYKIKELKERADVKALVDALSYDEVLIRVEIVDALCEIGEKSVPYLIKAIGNKSLTIAHRKYATWALGRIGDERAVEPLKKIVSDREHFGLFRDAIKALESLGYEIRQSQ